VHNKTALITGASSGIGYETALGLAKKGAEVIITGRDEERTKRAVQKIIEQSNNSRISHYVADLRMVESARWLAQTILDDHLRLDILINNVGAMSEKRIITQEGFEATWALNHLSAFTLTYLLLDLLKESGRKSAKSRIINVSSSAHKGAILDLAEVINNEKPYEKWRAYGQSKLANIMFTYALATRLEGHNVSANCLHPGVIGTGFIANIGKIERLLAPIIKIVLTSPEKGAKTSIYLASSSEVENHSGNYFINEEPAFSSDYSYDEDLQEQLWERSFYQGIMAFEM